MWKTVLFQTIQFSISTQFSFISPIDRTLSGVTTPGQNGPGSDGSEGVFCIPQSSSITGTSPSDFLASYQDTRCGVPPPRCRESVSQLGKLFCCDNSLPLLTETRKTKSDLCLDFRAAEAHKKARGVRKIKILVRLWTFRTTLVFRSNNVDVCWCERVYISISVCRHSVYVCTSIYIWVWHIFMGVCGHK